MSTVAGVKASSRRMEESSLILKSEEDNEAPGTGEPSITKTLLVHLL